MFTLRVISSTSLCFFGGALVLQENKILRLLLVGLFAGPGCSAAIVLSNKFPLFEIDVTVTGMVLPLRRTVIYCCTRSVLAADAATDAMLGHAGSCGYVGARVGDEVGRST